VRNALDESKNRVKAMSLVHENLYMSKNFSQINIKEYTKLLIEDVENYYSYIPNLVIEDNIIDENIGLDTAIPLGLFINENFNGSIFYGFENGKYLKENNIPGIITIDLSKNDDYYILKITDNGSGKEPDSVGKYGITTELMESLAIQLNGDLSVNMDDGMDLILKFPIE
jgi:two-component sensor histidine kinase